MNGLHLRLVYLLVMVNVAVHVTDDDLPKWITLIGLVFVSWRWIADFVKIPVPGRWGAAGFAVVCSVGIWAEFGRLIGDPAATALLIVMVALKTFEIRGYRDLMIVTYLCLLLLMSKLLENQSIAITVFLVADTVAVLALMHLYHVPKLNRGLPWRRAGRLVLQSLPVILVLFVLFPRFNFSLFKRPDQMGAKVGFSGHVRPGGVAQLAQSDEIAFRAFFKGNYVPPVSKLYWRGAVLTDAKGLNWDPSSKRGKVFAGYEDENPIEVMVESSGSSWVFTMDWPQGVIMSSRARQGEVEEAPGGTYALKSPLQERESYRFSFSPINKSLRTAPEEIKQALVVEEPSRKVKELVGTWRERRASAQEYVTKIQDYFTANKFMYTMRPPETEDVEEFLFYTKRGFCEHFAGVTATLLRMLNVPARVIVGYHGGSLSLMGDYVIVAQRDAHAWVEYWDAEKTSWTRIDPTSWVAEDRLAMGGQQFFEVRQEDDIAGLQGMWFKKVLGKDFFYWLTRGRLVVDQAEIFWVTFLLRFDINYQRDLFAKIGWEKISTWSLFGLALLGVAVLVVLAAWIMRSRVRGRPDSGLWLYQQLCAKLASAGLERQVTEGPFDLKARAEVRWPAQGEQLKTIFDRIIHIRYGDSKYGEREVAEIRRALKQLKFVNAPSRH